MKKLLSQISLILLIMIIGLVSVLIPNTYAADSIAGIKCPTSVNEGEKFSVSLIIPSDVYAAEANILVKFSNGNTSSGKMVYVKGMDDFPNSVSFEAKVAGNVQISITNIILSDINNNPIEQGGVKNATLTVIGKTTNSGSTTTGGSSNSNPSTSENGNSGTNNNSNAGNSGNQESPSTTQNFTNVNETVYTTTRCNLRENDSTSSNKVATVNAGTKLTRIGVGNSGWSKLEYNGKTVYASSQYLTTTAPNSNENKTEDDIKFKEVKETLYAKQSCNLRASWSTDSEKVGYLTKGQEVNRIGYANNGWSKILYNGKNVYVASRLLVDEKPEEDKKENIVENETVIDSTIINENIEASQDEMLNIIKEEVGVLPEVGTNAANIAYIIVTIMALLVLFGGIIYIKKIK